MSLPSMRDEGDRDFAYLMGGWALYPRDPGLGRCMRGLCVRKCHPTLWAFGKACVFALRRGVLRVGVRNICAGMHL